MNLLLALVLWLPKAPGLAPVPFQAEPSLPPHLMQGSVDSSNIRLTRVWRLGSSLSSAVDTLRGYLFLHTGLAVKVYDLSTPTAPVEVATIETHDAVFDMAYDPATQRLYVVNHYDGIVDIWDMSTPSSPVLLNSLYTGHRYRWEVAVRNDTLFLGPHHYSPYMTLFLYDVHNPAAITRLDSLVMPSVYPAFELQVAGSYVFAACRDSGLQIVDLGTLTRVAVFDSTAYDLVVAGSYAYLATDRGLVVLDVSNPTSPVQVGFLALPSTLHARMVFRHDTLNFLYSPPRWDTLATLRQVDVTNPSAPVLVDSLKVPNAYFPGEPSVYGNFVYAPINGGGCIIFQAHPLAVQQQVNFFSYWAVDYAFVYPYLFIPIGLPSALRVFDLTDPTNPVAVTTLLLNTAGYPQGIYRQGNRLYVAVGGIQPGLQVVNISNPTAPYVEGTLQLSGTKRLWGVAVSGDYAYVGELGDSLYVVDISNPSSPQRVSALYLPFQTTGPYGGRRRIAISGNYAYVTWGGLHIVDISDPLHPVRVSGLARYEDSWDVALSGSYALVAWRDSLEVVDVSDPQNPSIVAGYRATISTIEGVSTFNNWAVVAHWGDGVRLLDITNPAAPVERGFYDWPNYAWRAGYLYGNYLLSLNSLAGFSIHEYYGGPPTAVAEDAGISRPLVRVVYGPSGPEIRVSEPGDLRIWDATGRLVWRRWIRGSAKASGLRSGVYFWRLEPRDDEKKNSAGKFFLLR